MPDVTLVLASASPARLRTLQSAGVQPLVVVSEVDEADLLAEIERSTVALDPVEVSLVLARAKATDVAARLRGADVAARLRGADVAARGRGADGGLVLGCDSVLELDGEAHGKPADADEARARWRRMRGATAVLHTGHWLIDDRSPDDGGSRGAIGSTSSTVVHFAELSDGEIEAYVATGEPLAVAGGFTIDGLGGPFVTGVEGDHHGVVGLSLPLLRELLAEVGVAWFDLARG